MIRTAAEDRLCAGGSSHKAQVGAAHERSLAVDGDIVELTGFEGHICAGGDGRRIDAMRSAVHSKLSGQGNAGNADTAGAIVYITERHQGRISAPFGAPAVQGLDGLYIAVPVFDTAVRREPGRFYFAIGSSGCYLNDQHLAAFGAHRLFYRIIVTLMDALCELYLVRRITRQAHNFSALINDAPCTVPFAVQFTLCMVGFQQVAAGKILVSILGQRNCFDSAAVGVILPQLHAITGSITRSQEQFLNRTGVSLQHAAGTKLHAQNVAGVGVVNRQRSVGPNRKLDIERLRPAALAGILDRQFFGDTDGPILAGDRLSMQIQRYSIGGGATSIKVHIPHQCYRAAIPRILKRLCKRLIIGALAYTCIELRMALFADIAGIVHFMSAEGEIDLAVLAQTGHAVGGVCLEVLGAERHAACRFGNEETAAGIGLYAFIHAHTDDRILTQCA